MKEEERHFGKSTRIIKKTLVEIWKMTVTQHLRRIWKSVPLKRLHQGSTLTIRSKLMPATTTPTHLVVQPAWKDDGHAEFEQILSSAGKNDDVVDMVVKQEEDKLTSLGRVASHVSIELLQRTTTSEPRESNRIKSTSAAEFDLIDTVPQSSPKPIDKLILDDGHIMPVEDVSDIPVDSDKVEYHDGIAHVLTKKGMELKAPGIYLTIQVPEKVNLACALDNVGSITITDKIEGDVQLRVNGDIRVKRLRGNTLQLKNGPNEIYVASLLEGQKVQVETQGRFRAKQIHGRSIDLIVDHTSSSSNRTAAVKQASEPTGSLPKIEDKDDEGSLVDVSAMFVSGNGVANVQVRGDKPLQRRAVRIKSHHGFLAVAADGLSKPKESNEMTGEIFPLIELGGVNGSCEVTVDNVRKGESDVDKWKSAQVHFDSLSPESVSFVTADRGDISVTLDRKAEADLRLLSSSQTLAIPWTEIGPVLVDDDDHDNLLCDLRQKKTMPLGKNDTGRISIQTKAFTGRQQSFTTGTRLSYVEGWVENKSHEPDSRFELKTRGVDASVGKIRVDEAAGQALDSFSSSNKAGPVRPLLAVAGRQNITLETVSWLGAIARRYGLEEESGKRDLGRTASRRGRPIIPSDE